MLLLLDSGILLELEETSGQTTSDFDAVEVVGGSTCGTDGSSS